MGSDLAARPAELRPSGLANKITDFLLRYGAYVALLAVFAYFSLRSPVFLTATNMIRVLQQVAVLAIAAFGMTTVVMGGGTHIIEGGIDLSIGAQIGLAAGIYSVMMRDGFSVPEALGVGLAATLLIGLLNGLAVVYLRILPLLATLAMMFVVGGVELLVTNNLVISVNIPFVRTIADGAVLGIPIPVVILLVTFGLYYVLLHRTPVGVHIQAIGSNREAARRAGLPVKGFTILTYVLAGLAAAISSVVVIGRLSGSTRGIGPLLFLDIVLAAYVSTMFSPKWAMNIPGAFLGALFVGILTNGFTMINIPTYWVHAVKGLLILFVVAATSLQKKRSSVQ